MMRIIAGQAKGRRLQAPRTGTRPTADRVRESIFSSLTSQLGQWTGVRVLDLYAGTGALGLEAMSRGAQELVAVDSARGAVQAIRDNAAACGVAVTVKAMPVATYLAKPAQPFDVVFVDPPYDDADQLPAVLHSLAKGWLGYGATVVIEYPTRLPPPAVPAGFDVATPREFGDTSILRVVWYVRT